MQCRRALKPDGLLLAVMFGGDTLHELRVAVAAAEEAVEGGISQRVSPLAQASITSGRQYSRLLSLDNLHLEVPSLSGLPAQVGRVAIAQGVQCVHFQACRCPVGCLTAVIKAATQWCHSFQALQEAVFS